MKINTTKTKFMYCAFIILVAFVIFGSLTKITAGMGSKVMASNTTDAITDNQKIVQEVGMAYYRRGMGIQYGNDFRDHFSSPEQTTSQSSNYLVCTGFTFAVYYEAFGMFIPDATARFASYANTFYGQPDHPDIVYFSKGEEYKAQVETAGARTEFRRMLLGLLQVGDIISYTYDNGRGHAVLIYDIEYDEEGNKTDAVILHSNANYSKVGSKLDKGLSWNDHEPNSITGVDEGTVKMIKLSDTTETSGPDYFTVYRPLALGEDTYNKVSCVGTECTSEVTTYEQTDNSKARLSYSGIQIEKTVDVFNNSVVQPNDTLTYNIMIKNSSDRDYDSGFRVVENIPSDLVFSVDDPSTSTLAWDVPALLAGETYSINYTVRVKNDSSVIGETIVSTGSVAGISSAIVINTIGRNLDENEEASVEASYNELKDQYSGVELIDKIYEAALDKTTNFSNLILGAHYNTGSDSSVVKYRSSKCNPYFRDEDVNALINTTNGSTFNTISLNKNNPFSRMVLGSYYSALNLEYDNSCNLTSATRKRHRSRSEPGFEATDRRKRVYPENLQTGDVLIYANTGAAGSPDPVTGEDGVYAFIWIDDNFYGVNELADGTELNLISGVNGKGSNNLLTLFGKDYYAIFRPSLSMEFDFDENTDDETTNNEGGGNNSGNGSGSSSDDSGSGNDSDKEGNETGDVEVIEDSNTGHDSGDMDIAKDNGNDDDKEDNKVGDVEMVGAPNTGHDGGDMDMFAPLNVHGEQVIASLISLIIAMAIWVRPRTWRIRHYKINVKTKM